MWVLIDTLFLAHRARYSLRNMHTDDMSTGILFDFFEQLYTICTHPKIQSNKILIFIDSKRSWRKKKLPTYKGQRSANRTEEEWEQINIMHDQINILRKELFPQLGIHVYGQTGLESDDLMAWAAKELTKRKENGVIITSDGDLCQCITPYVHWYDPMKRLYLDPKSFEKRKGVTPVQYAMVKALGGCSTDNVPGIKGVSEQSAIDYLFGRIPTHYKKYESIKTAESNGDIEKWKELVILPHYKTKPFNIQKPQYNIKVFFEFCEKYEILSYLTDAGKKRWSKFFKNNIEKNKTRRRKNKTLL